MRRLAGLCLGALLALIFPSFAATSNFEFVVPGQSGLRLVITGFDQNGARLFREIATDPEQRGGTTYYVIRVDEQIIFNNQLAKWCVTDFRKKWNLLPQGLNELCDENPRDNRGSFAFVPTFSEPAPAEPEVASYDTLVCAAEALQRTGFLSARNSVPQEEAIRRAAARFTAVQKNDPKLPELSDKTLDKWCERFAAIEKKGVTPLPALLAELNFGPDVSVPLARETAAALLQADRFLEFAVGYRPPVPPAIYISADASWMTDGYAERTPLRESDRADREAQFAACNGGEANYRMMFMCTKSKVFSEDWFGVGAQIQHAYALVHELFHVIQNELVGPAGNGCCNEQQSLERIGPTWLIEGGAEYVAFQLLSSYGWKGFAKEMQHQATEARKSGLRAADVELRGPYYSDSDANYVGLAAAHEVAGTLGAQVMPRFWLELGQQHDWKAAFEAAFGITPASFYEAGDRRVAEVVTPGEMVKCLQGALNHLGFDAGPVDGQLGRSTRTALATYAAKHDALKEWELNRPEDSGPVCLYLARETQLDDASEALAERLARQSAVTFFVGADPEGVAAIMIRDYGGNILVATDILPMVQRPTENTPIKFVKLPYAVVRNGSEVCLTAAEGWVVKDKDGKTFRASCGRLDPALAVKGLGFIYKVERG